jgi:hypothetical protein
MKRAIAVALTALTFGIGGCGPTTPPQPKFIDDIRPIPPALKEVSFAIQRRDLEGSLEREGEAPPRLVPVFASVSSRESYEYRIFDLKPGSPYELLGLQNSDIIVSANRYLIKRPEQFYQFVQLLRGENDATIEIRRGGEGRLLKYSFIPALQR